MSFGWENYLHLAQKLAGEADEASQRSAISRAYYAAFHVARRYVERVHPDLVLRRHGAEHGEIWDRLKSGSHREPALGHQGDRLRAKRVMADYRLVGLKFPQDTKMALEQAGLIIRSLTDPAPPAG